LLDIHDRAGAERPALWLAINPVRINIVES
jgi:hypothetical protein